MEFTLYYRGPLKANSGPKEKHRLRQYFHGQLKELWNQKPLESLRDYLDKDNVKTLTEEPSSIIKLVGPFECAPLVCSELALLADLSITMLRPEPPGTIVTQGGDIDNRLKTLLDALKAPDQPDALPKGANPQENEVPLFCLLEDDSLIARLEVTTDRLLDPDASSADVVLLIHVRTKPTVGTIENLTILA